jgi:hypothetical protein
MYIIQAGLILSDFAVMLLEDLHRFLNLLDSFWFNAFWQTQSLATLVLCWRLAETDVTVMPLLMCMD